MTSFPDVKVVVLGDLDQQRARVQAEKHGVPESGSNDDVLSHPDVEIIVNLTIPAVHALVASQAIAVCKHVWTEKPISTDRSSGLALLERADAVGLLVGSHPTRCSARACTPLGAFEAITNDLRLTADLTPLPQS